MSCRHLPTDCITSTAEYIHLQTRLQSSSSSDRSQIVNEMAHVVDGYESWLDLDILLLDTNAFTFVKLANILICLINSQHRVWAESDQLGV